jgi:tRNA pseudouridine38-40 synthase
VARSDFHARRSATRKEYRYFVWNDAVMPPERRLYAAHVPHPLDVSRMHEAARAFVGKHDFAAFTANPNREVESTVREIFAFTVTARGHAITFRVCGNGFLYKQVRSMVGFLLRVGAGAETPEAVSGLLDARSSRTARVPSAVPQGLFLWRVWYR